MHEAAVVAISRLNLVDNWVTPFMRISNSIPKPARMEEFLAPFRESGKPVFLQLMGTDMVMLAECAALAKEIGVAGIDLNFGCPSNQVLRNGAGGGILKHPDRAAKIAAGVKSAIGDLPLSIKTRIGFASPEEQEYLLPALAQSCVLSHLTVHFRTVCEQYRPAPNREYRLKRAAELAAPVPVVGNGDILSTQEARKLAATGGLAGVMIGRGFFRHPEILHELNHAGSPFEGGEALRRKLFGEILRYALEKPGFRFSNGCAIESANLLWGKGNTVLERLKGASADGWKKLVEEF